MSEPSAAQLGQTALAAALDGLPDALLIVDAEWTALAEVSQSLIATPDTGETATRLAQLVVPRLADWATVMVIGADGALLAVRWPPAVAPPAGS